MFNIISEKSKAVSDSNVNLCLTCTNYSAKTYALNDKEQNMCMASYQNPIRLRGPVSRCTDFLSKVAPSKRDMEKIAYVIEVSKRVVGFGHEMSINFLAPSERKEYNDE